MGKSTGTGDIGDSALYALSDKPTGPLFVFSGGGTGGHLFPAVAIIEALQTRFSDLRILFFATQRPIDQRILGDLGCEWIRQDLPGLPRAPWRWPGMYRTFTQARRYCRQRFQWNRPAAVIGTGGLASLPALLEAIHAKIPAVLLNPDAIPGRANRYISGFCDAVFVQWEEAMEAFPRSNDVHALGCPVRAEFNSATREAGISRFDLDADRKTLLVTGASQGSRSINEAVLANVEFFESRSDWQILHISGEQNDREIRTVYGQRNKLRGRVRIIPFTPYMADALGAADLVVSRAGASSLAEITAVGRAAVLMPYPYHRDLHQLANARCLVRHGAARIVHDRIDPAINAPELRKVLEHLMADDSLRESMASAGRRIGRGQAAAGIADHLIRLAADRGTMELRENLEILCYHARYPMQHGVREHRSVSGV